MKRNVCLPALLALLAVAPLAFAYEYPLSSAAIREAYLIGSTTNGASAALFSRYTHTLPQLKLGACPSTIRIETPYTQIAEHSRVTPNYSAEGAVRDFTANPPSMFRMQMDLCFGHTEPQSVKFKVVQNGRELTPITVDRSPFFPISDETSTPPSIGEHIHLELRAGSIDSSDLTIKIVTADAQHAETTFDLARLR